MMRVYHFIDEVHGLQDLREKRLKIARINELNDPFELMGVELSNCELRQAMENMKEDVSAKLGILCFSESWESPVQWAHYANRHKGLCLGFDVPKRFLTKVNYCDKRLPADHFIATHAADAASIKAEMTDYIGQPESIEEREEKREKFFEIVLPQRLREITESDQKGLAMMENILSTKFSHWEYEKEYRVFRELDQEVWADGLYFAKFSNELDLKEVIVGVRSSITLKDVRDALGKIANSVIVDKAREDFCEFAMVRDGGI